MARLAILALTTVAAGLAGQRIWSEDTGDAGHSAIAATVMGCDIKSNISMNTGERIYHLPGQKFYSQMIIAAGKGERWFCSEDEARAAG